MVLSAFIGGKELQHCSFLVARGGRRNLLRRRYSPFGFGSLGQAMKAFSSAHGCVTGILGIIVVASLPAEPLSSRAAAAPPEAPASTPSPAAERAATDMERELLAKRDGGRAGELAQEDYSNAAADERIFSRDRVAHKYLHYAAPHVYFPKHLGGSGPSK